MKGISKKLAVCAAALALCAGFSFAKPQSLDKIFSLAAEGICDKIPDGAIVAVYAFESPRLNDKNFFVDEFERKLLQEGTLTLVSRSEIDTINREIDFQKSGFVSDETMLSICKILGAEVIVTGRISEWNEYGEHYSAQIKALSVETGRVIFSRAYELENSAALVKQFGNPANFKKASLGALVEANKNSFFKVAPCAGVQFAYSPLQRLAVGAKFLISADFADDEFKLISFEPLAILRWYFYIAPGRPGTGLFLQAEAGADAVFHSKKVFGSFDGGAALGYRIPLGRAYLEFAGRFGYPYIFGISAQAGMRF